MIMKKYIIGPRGSTKSVLFHFRAIDELYRSGAIDKKEYIIMIADLRRAYLNESEKEVSEGLEEQLEEQE